MTLPIGFNTDCKSIMDALSRSQAIIQFDMTGKILTANQIFVPHLDMT